MPYRSSELRVPRPPRVRARRAVVGFALLGLAGSAGVLHRRYVARSRVPAEPRAAPTRRPSDDDLATCRPWLARVPHDGVTEVVDGARRLTVLDDGRIAAAGSNLHANVVAVEHGADGWLFVDHSGLVEHSETFLGPLRLVGRFPSCFRRFVPAPRGSVAALDDEGRLWITDAHHGPTLVSPAGRVMRAAFREDAQGIALLEDGSLARTSNAGRSWATVDCGVPLKSRQVASGESGVSPALS